MAVKYKEASATHFEGFYIVCPNCGKDIYMNIEDLYSEHVDGLHIECDDCKQPIVLTED